MRTGLILAALASALVLPACGGVHDEGGLRAAADDGFGNAVRTNIAVQTVNPQAPEDGAHVSASGERAAIAVDRYAKDKVKEPADPETSASIGGSGSGSNGAGLGGSGK